MSVLLITAAVRKVAPIMVLPTVDEANRHGAELSWIRFELRRLWLAGLMMLQTRKEPEAFFVFGLGLGRFE